MEPLNLRSDFKVSKYLETGELNFTLSECGKRSCRRGRLKQQQQEAIKKKKK